MSVKLFPYFDFDDLKLVNLDLFSYGVDRSTLFTQLILLSKNKMSIDWLKRQIIYCYEFKPKIMKRTTLSLNKELVRYVDKLCLNLNCSYSEYFRFLMTYYIRMSYRDRTELLAKCSKICAFSKHITLRSMGRAKLGKYCRK
ncbi:MAG: hypothetical protein SOV68_12700 [Ligilactobacillus salivarius]|nr:hypothetical protein [Ligilactobacillus salivarius]